MLGSKNFYWLVLHTYFLINFDEAFSSSDELTFYNLYDSYVCSANKAQELKVDSEIIVDQSTLFLDDIKLDENGFCKFKVQTQDNTMGINVDIHTLNLYKNDFTGECIDYVQFRTKNSFLSKKFCYQDLVDYIISRKRTDFSDIHGEIDVILYMQKNHYVGSPTKKLLSIYFQAYFECDLGDDDVRMCDKAGCIINYDKYERIDPAFVLCPFSCTNGSCTLKPKSDSNSDETEQTFYFNADKFPKFPKFDIPKYDYPKLEPIDTKFDLDEKYNQIYRPRPQNESETTFIIFPKFILYIFIVVIKVILYCCYVSCCKKPKRNTSILEEGRIDQEVLIRNPAETTRARAPENHILILEGGNQPTPSRVEVTGYTADFSAIRRAMDEARSMESNKEGSSTQALDSTPPNYEDLPQPPAYNTLFHSNMK